MTSAPSVLVTDSGAGLGRSSLAAVRAARLGGYKPVVATWGTASLAAASRWCAGIVRVPAPDDAEAFSSAIRAELETNGHVAALAASDAALRVLQPEARHLIDKVALAGRARAVGLRAPTGKVFDSVMAFRAAAESGQVDLPVVVKPVVSTAPAAVIRLIDEAGIDFPGPVLAQPVLSGELRAISLLISQGSAVAAVAQVAQRTWPRAAGTSCYAESVAVDESTLEKVVELASPYEGILQVQFLGDHLIDANPRVFGSIPLAVASGANLVAMYLDTLRGRPVEPVRGRVGARYRWIEGDIRHVVDGLRHRDLGIVSAGRALRPKRHVAHSVEALCDPGPAIARLRFAFGRA